jgi:4-azaleucine resistance transporter AzlC
MAAGPSSSSWPAGLAGGARSIAPLLPAVVAFGVSFGVLARAAGMGLAAPIVMSATTFAGSAQFAAASILESGTAAAAISAAILLNSRYAPMSIAVGPWFTGPPWRRLLSAQLIVDESWTLAARGDGRFDVPALFGVGLVLYPFWVGSTALGAVAGDLLADPDRLGLDAAFPALFLALLVGLVRSRRAVAAAVAGGLIALVLVPLSAPGVPIIVASAACLLGVRRAGAARSAPAR